MKYALTASPSPAPLGAPVMLTLSAFADVPAADALTFEHKSLTIELSRAGTEGEPWVSLPNRRVIEADGMLLREGTAGGIEDLKAGDTATQEYALEKLFPLEVLAPGAFVVTYSLATQQREVRPPPLSLEILSGPPCVELLFAVLESSDAARRSVAAMLLKRMTGKGDAYDAFASEAERNAQLSPWRSWWTTTGAHQPWNFASEGATTGEKPAPPPRAGLSLQLGGVAFDGTSAK